MGGDHPREFLFDGLHARRVGVIYMITAHKVDEAMDQEPDDFLYFAIITHPLVHHVQGDHDISQDQGVRFRVPAVPLDGGGLGAGEGEHVGGTVLSAPLEVQFMNERVVAQDEGELTSFQAEVSQEVVGYPFYRRDPGSPGQPRRTMSYGE